MLNVIANLFVVLQSVLGATGTRVVITCIIQYCLSLTFRGDCLDWTLNLVSLLFNKFFFSVEERYLYSFGTAPGFWSWPTPVSRPHRMATLYTNQPPHPGRHEPDTSPPSLHSFEESQKHRLLPVPDIRLQPLSCWFFLTFNFKCFCTNVYDLV